jgi:hypothetical protein
MIRFDPKENQCDLDLGMGPQPRAAMGNAAQARGRCGGGSQRQASPMGLAARAEELGLRWADSVCF